MADAYEQLEESWAEIADISHGLSILSWDQEVMMPPGGAELRAHTLAALTGVLHGRTTSTRLARLVDGLHRGRARLTPRRRRAVELVRRDVDRARKIPARLAKEVALTESRGLEAWRAARAASDFARFAPVLARMVELKREVAARVAGRGVPPYDALLDAYEPGATQASIDPLLTALRDVTVPLVRRVVESGVRVDLSPLVGRFDVDAQKAFARQVAEAMGIAFERGRLDLSTHPFCSGVGPGDVRLTSRYDARDMRGGLFGVIHEAGHGLYEQGLDPARARSPLGGAISMAVHESQSRLWENLVARGRPFWTYWLPRLKKAHPQLRRTSVDAMWRASNAMAPSPIRVEADELTYNLHIVLRYEIERDLFAGSLEVDALPARWNADMQALLGITPKDDARGVLQDIHWAMGAFGYFPTYSLGNLLAAQLMEAARQAIRGLDGKIARGDLLTLREWLRTSIHRHDRVYTAEQITKRVTGKPLSVEPFARYITKKVDALYG